jgi:hypothetical protein
MPAKNPATKRRRKVTDVDTYMRELEHPCKKEMQALRKIILGVDPRITEEIKWNAPSFALGEHFVTFHGWAKDYVQLIFHHGPKKATSKGVPIDDPEGLLEWLATDRASIPVRHYEGCAREEGGVGEDREVVDTGEAVFCLRCAGPRGREGET